MTGVDNIKKIRQLRYIKGLSLRDISSILNISVNTIRKILKSNKTKFNYQRKNPSQPVTGSYRNLIEKWLIEDLNVKKKNRRTAKRIFDILKLEHEYKGSYPSIALCVCKLKKKIKPIKPEGFIPLSFEPGEAFQFDWGEVSAKIGDEILILNLAITVLCNSGVFFAKVYPRQKQEFLLDAHKESFRFFGGVCKRGIYDNMKTAVKQILKGNHRNLSEKFVRFCSHYLYEPNFCNPARGNEKGKVENKVGYVRRNFFVPLTVSETIDDLNEKLENFCIKKNKENFHPSEKDKTCSEMFEKEKLYLIELPEHDFECCKNHFLTVNTLSLVTFENNKYSVPSEYIGKTVHVKGYVKDIVISFKGKKIATHKRLFEKFKKSYNPYHYLNILERKPGAYKNGEPFKNWKLPEVFKEYHKKLKEKYDDGDINYVKTLILLKDWSLEEVTLAINECIEIGLIGESYLIALLRKQIEEPKDNENVSLKIELTKYKAEQRPLKDYDIILRFKKGGGTNNEQTSKDHGAFNRSETGRIQKDI